MNSSFLPLTVVEATPDLIRVATEVCRAAAQGDLEPRVQVRSDDPQLTELGQAIYAMLDSTDAFVRESSASLKAASEGRFFRKVLVQGMPGTFRRSALIINEASDDMSGQEVDQPNHAEFEDARHERHD